VPPELGPEEGRKDRSSTAGNTDSETGLEGPQETEPHSRDKRTSAGPEKEGDSQAAKDPDTTEANDKPEEADGPEAAKEHERAESERNREPTSHTTEGTLLAATEPGARPEIKEGERISKDTDKDGSADEDKEITPNTDEEGGPRKLKEHVADMSPEDTSKPFTLQGPNEAEQEEDCWRSKPSKTAAIEPGTTATEGNTSSTTPGSRYKKSILDGDCRTPR